MLVWLTRVALSLILLTVLPVEAVQTVIYPQPQSKNDHRYDDLISLLGASLKATEAEYGAYKLMPAKYLMNETRYIEEVKFGKRINVVWRSTSEKLERELLVISIPLRKGLLGYRLFLIHKDRQADFSAVKTLNDLKRFSVGQGASWGDVGVFSMNNFNVITGANYEGLFHMLLSGRFDYFSRGVNEAYPEYEARRERMPNLWVEEDLLLYYPWPYYFFVSPKTPMLKTRIEQGLTTMHKTGEFDKIFYQYHGNTIEKANLRKRRLFRIDNPLLPSTTPLDKTELWYSPLDN